VTALEAAGATVEHVDPDIDCDRHEVLDAFYTFAKVLWESLFDSLESQGLDPHGADREKLRPVTIETILESDSVSTREYKRADVTRTKVYDGIVDLLREYDVLVTPTLAVTPFAHGDFPTEIDGKEVEPLRGWLLTAVQFLRTSGRRRSGRDLGGRSSGGNAGRRTTPRGRRCPGGERCGRARASVG